MHTYTHACIHAYVALDILTNTHTTATANTNATATAPTHATITATMGNYTYACSCNWTGNKITPVHVRMDAHVHAAISAIVNIAIHMHINVHVTTNLHMT